MSKKTNTVIKNDHKGVKAILEQSLQSYERLPMLEIIFDKFTRHLVTSLRNLTSEPINIAESYFSSLRFSNYFDKIKFPYSISVFKAVEWQNLGLLILDNNLIFTLVDLLLGGKKNIAQGQTQSPNRILTSIEQGLAKQISEIILTELSSAFDQISPSTFTFERLENNPNFVAISRPGDAVIILTIKIRIDKLYSNVEILIPYKTIEPIKEQMQQMFLGDKFGTNKEWDTLLKNIVCEIKIPVDAVITSHTSTVQKIAKLKVGDTFIMDHGKNQDVLVRTGSVPLFTGKIGKVDNKVAINLKDFYT